MSPSPAPQRTRLRRESDVDDGLRAIFRDSPAESRSFRLFRPLYSIEPVHERHYRKAAAVGCESVTDWLKTPIAELQFQLKVVPGLLVVG